MKTNARNLLSINRFTTYNNNSHKCYRNFLVLLGLIFLSAIHFASAQARAQVASPQMAPPGNGPPPTPAITGPVSATGGTTSAYTGTDGVSGVTYYWTMTSSAGTISYSGTSATVHWSSSFSGMATIYCSASNSYGSSANGTKSVTVTAASPPLTAGTISPASQTLSMGSTAAVISATATGGSGSITYQWQSSPDNGLNNDWVNVSTSNTSGTSTSFNPGIVYEPMCYREAATNSGTTVYTSSSVISINDCYQLNTAPGTTNNYIITTDFRMPSVTSPVTDAQIAAMGVCDANQTIQYLDGLGRPIQTVQVKASPNGNDMVQPMAYDQYGREPVTYLPYITPGTNDGAYRSAAITEQATYYNPTNSATLTQQSNGIVNTSYPFAQTNFEPSPLNRVVEKGAPGAAWQPIAGNTMGHTNKVIYSTNNTTTFATDSVNGNAVVLYNATINSDNSRTLSSNGYYAAGTLYVTISQDENWHTGRAGTVEEYKDIEGHVILKRTYNYTSPTVQMLSTYYIYDNLGDLAFVLTPASGADTGTPAQAILDNLCYQYRYDARNRLVQKKLPGKGWEFTIYNTLDQVTFTQDANQRNPSQGSQVWTYIQYDPQGRVAITGIWNSAGASGSNPDGNISAPSTTLLNWLNVWQNAQTQFWITRNNSNSTGYMFLNPQGGAQLLKINYYDDYLFPGQPATFTTPAGSSIMTRGLPTGSKTMVLNTINNNTPDMLTDVTYYDDLGRATQVYKQHYFGGSLSPYNYDQVTNTYNFANQVTATTRQHYVTNSGNTAATLSMTINNSYVYDHDGRKLQTWEQIGSGTNILLSAAAYNEIGQLLNKNLYSTNSGGSYLQSIAYTYNERGWMLSNSAPLFQEQLQYNSSTINGVSINPQYNGNIASASWGTQASQNGKTYTFGYDKLNRLLSGTSAVTGNNESGIAYDPMGNITALNRAGSSTDNLSYNYTLSGIQVNQLQSVTDNSGSNTGLVNGITSYTYDNNGNEASQTNTANSGQNKTIVYNMLNLPQQYTLATGTVTYTYDADGNKLRKIDVISGNTTTEDYISGIQHTTGGAIDFIQTEEGRAFNSSGNYHYEYSLTDHLGNERITFDTYTGSAVQTQSDDYYPFGLEINNSVTSPKNEYLYNKKELQEELGQYDYGARFYDPVIARWTTVDPLAEKSRRFSPYDYGDDNSIRNIDPDGMETEGCCGVFLNAVGQGFVNNYKSMAHTVMHPIDAAKSITVKGAAEFLIGSTPQGMIVNSLKENVAISKALISGDQKTAGNMIGNGLANATTAAVTEGLVGAVGKGFSALSGAAKSLDVGFGADLSGLSKSSTLEPGPFAGNSIPASNSAPVFTQAERDAVNQIGSETGCHTCGVTTPGTKSGNFIPDHQPSSALVEPGTPQDLYPHCVNCSARQGGEVRVAKSKQN